MAEKLMLWKAVYDDNVTILNEDVNTFDEIDRSRLKTFSLIGMDTEFIHYVKTGQTFINDNRILFLLNDRLLGKSNDIINYKEKIFSVNNPYSKFTSDDIIGYYTGWKEKNEDFDRIELLYWVDMLNQEVKVRLTLTPNNEKVLKSNFSMIINGVIQTVDITFPNINRRERFVFEIFKQ